MQYYYFQNCFRIASKEHGRLIKFFIKLQVRPKLFFVSKKQFIILKIFNILEGDSNGSQTQQDGLYEPWPNFRFTGKLRPYPQSPKRIVPPSIPRPDYADHPTGAPLGELAIKGSAQIKVLSDEEIEGMRVACKVYTIIHKTNFCLKTNYLLYNNFFSLVGKF